MAGMSPYEATARARKAFDLITVIDRANGLGVFEEPVTADTLADLDDAGWETLAKLAGLPPQRYPSAQTRALVVDLLRDREAAPDPFAGLPT